MTSQNLCIKNASINQIFEGLHDQVTNEESIFREPIATKSLRLIPRTWEGNIVMQFEVMGCYNYERITCAGN